MKSRLTDRQKNQIARRNEAPDQHLEPGIVITHHGTELIIETADGRLLRATARRTLGALTTGDKIGWRTGKDQREIIEHLYPRTNTLIRPDTHGKLRLMAANIDQVLIVVAPVPWMNPNIVEQAIVATLDLPATPLIVLNKIDQLSQIAPQEQTLIEATLTLWQAQDIDIIRVSAQTGEGIDALRAQLANQLSMMIGLSGVGKTSLATNMAFAAAERWKAEKDRGIPDDKNMGAPVAFFSLEMAADQLATRILAEQAGVDSESLRKGRLTQGQMDQLVEAAGRLNSLPLYIDDTPALTIAALRARARRLKRKYDIRMVVIDYLQLLQGSSRSGDNRV
ncbi:MAG: hypothetical protein B7Y53_05295, partial [Halothiobacillus sp. 28-55-5]